MTWFSVLIKLFSYQCPLFVPYFCGMPDVFAHGMLVMAYMARALTDWVPQRAMRDFGGRFASITNLGDKLTVEGKITEKFDGDGERRLRLELSVINQDKDVKIIGNAVVALD